MEKHSSEFNSPLKNLKILRDNMVQNEIAVTVFRFVYKKIAYYVAICLLTEEERQKKDAKFALVRLCFMLENDLNRCLDCYANSTGITADITDLRHFLGVEYQPNGRVWIETFYEYLGKYIPTVPHKANTQEQKVIVHTICIHEHRDPNRVYRYYMFRNGKKNGKQMHRTEYNGQLASYKFPALYPKFRNDKTISFAFDDNPDNEKSEDEVLRNFEKNEHNR